MIHVKSFVFNPFMENTYVVYDDSRACVVIDPGCYEGYEQNELSSFIEQNDLKVVKLLNTHCHIDHVLGNQFVKDKYNVKLYVHPRDEEVLKAVKAYAPSYGFTHYEEATIDEDLQEGQEVTFGNTSLDVLFVPGHSPGHVAFVDHSSKKIIGGDVLFQGSIGRTDLPGGDHEKLIKSIQEKLFPLGDDYTVYCG
ncbi:MAG: MBL fold metallo-hydrolase, partial [Fulvivirga sp.]|nr:MBL fold metallo-hydrolase [Fulvivirga sp.]